MGSRLPSIRGLSENLGLSKTTVISAYDQLCAEGYIVNRPQKGYFVAADFRNRPAQVTPAANNSNLEPNTNDFFNAKKVFEAIRKDYKKKGGKELTLDEINKIIYGK